MTTRPIIDMALATRLTREGRLEEAMAVLRGQAPPATPPAAPPTEAVATGTLLDMVPPTSGAGPWEAPGPEQPGPTRRPRAPLGTALSRLKGLRPTGGLAGGLAGGLSGGLPRAAAPASPVPPGARLERRRHDGPAGRLDYRLYRPSARDGEALPLLVMLHGCTQSPEDFMAGTAMNAVAEEMGFLVAWPEQTRSANAQLCWSWFDARGQARDAGEVALIAGVVGDVVRAEGADPARVYAAGLSAGGAMAAALGALRPDLFAAIGVHSGLAFGAATDVPGAFAAMRQGAAGRATGGVPAIVLHGDRDPTVAHANAAAVAIQARGGASLRATTTKARSPGGMDHTTVVHRDAGGRAMLEEWALHGAGHAWSGGHAAGTYTDPAGPDASRAVARFLLGHRLG